jgi:hypothetical protein
MLMKLYHTTTLDKADSIMAVGFRDHATVNRRLTATYTYEPGVWFGDLPAIDDEWFDGIGLFNFDAERQAFVAVDAQFPYPGVRSSSEDSTWPGTQYWTKASVWNQFPRTRLSLDEVIRLRLTRDPMHCQMVNEWERGKRDYNVEFMARVRKVLDRLIGAVA